MITRTFSDPHPVEMAVKDPALDQIGSAMQLEESEVKVTRENQDRYVRERNVAAATATATATALTATSGPPHHRA